MEKSIETKKNLNSPKNELGKKKKNEYTKLIPFHIPSAKQAYFLPDQYKKNTVLINDLETLNDSSFTNNIDCVSNKDQQSLGDSLSIVSSRQGSKASFMDDKNKKLKFQKIQEELLKKEKDNILLKNEIIDLQKKINLNKDKDSIYQNKFNKLNEKYKNLEYILSNIKKEYKLKEKEYLEKIEQLKKDINNKNTMLNSLQEKIIYKNQIIQNLNNLIKVKDMQINESNKKIRKSENNKRNKEKNTINTINSKTNLNSNKENENYNNFKNINNNINKDNSKDVHQEFLKKYKQIKKENTKKERYNSNIENNNLNMTNKYQKRKIYHSGTYRNQFAQRQIKNYYFFDESKIKIQKNKVKDISLKKQIDNIKKSSNIKIDKNKNKNYENNSVKNISNLKLDRNYLRHFSNISLYSYTNKIKDPENYKDNKRISIINNFSTNNLIKEENPREVFMKRLYKNNKQIIKTSISDSTNSYNYISDNETNKSNFIKFNNSKNKNDNKSYDLNLNEYSKKNNIFYNNNTQKDNHHITSEKILKIINQKYRIPNNTRKSNSRIIGDNEYFNDTHSFLMENHSEFNEKKNRFIRGICRYKKPNLNHTNSIIDYKLNMSNNRNKFN